MRCMVCGVWCVLCDICGAYVCAVRCMVCGVWLAMCRVRCRVVGMYCAVYGVWCAVWQCSRCAVLCGVRLYVFVCASYQIHGVGAVLCGVRLYVFV